MENVSIYTNVYLSLYTSIIYIICIGYGICVYVDGSVQEVFDFFAALYPKFVSECLMGFAFLVGGLAVDLLKGMDLCFKHGKSVTIEDDNAFTWPH